MPFRRLYSIVALLIFGLPCFSRFAAAQATAAEPSAQQSVLATLASLSHLDEGSWRYHAGDMAHGELVKINDADWSVAEKNQHFDQKSYWLRQSIQLPRTLNGYNLDGARIWLRVRTNSRNPVILYFNGRRVALGEDLEPVVLFEHARAGDTVLVAIKLLATSRTKTFNGVELKIDFAADRPSPEDLRQRLIAAAKLTDAEVPTSSAHAAWKTAVDAVDLAALGKGDQAAFDLSLNHAGDLLAPVTAAAGKGVVEMTGNSHIDAAWLWPWTETVDVVKRTFSTALQLMNEYPDYTFTQSSAIYNEWMAEKYPEIDRQIRERVQQGRWEVVGGMWVEPDLNLPEGESTVRSILIGKRWYQQHYGVDVRIGWNPDSFGYNWQLPQIYKRSGIDYFVTQKMGWSETNKLPLKLFWWQSPDGSRVLTYFPNGYGNTRLTPERLSADLAAARKNLPGFSRMMDLYGVGDHGGGATRSMLDEGSHWAEATTTAPTMHFATARHYFSQIEQQLAPGTDTWNYTRLGSGFTPPAQPDATRLTLPTWNDELYLEYHRGVYTTQAELKANLRKAPALALTAEKFASLAWLSGQIYPAQEFDHVWKTIAFNSFHDIAAGSGIAVVYRDAHQEFDAANRISTDVLTQSLARLSASVNTAANRPQAASVPVLVWNPLGWQRRGRITLDVLMPAKTDAVTVLNAEGTPLPTELLARDASSQRFHLLVDVDSVPSIGYQLLHVVASSSTAATDLTATATTLENAHLRVVVDAKTGCISSLQQKPSGLEFLAAGACGNQLQAFHDLPKEYDAWNIDPGTLDQPTLPIETRSVRLLRQSPLTAAIEVTRTLGKSTIVQRLALDRDADMLRVETDVDWHEDHVLLKAAFPLAASSPVATYEIPYGSIERPTTRNNSWEKARFEVPALRWADAGNQAQGLSLLNDSKFGYDAVGNLLRLTLLRSPTAPDPDADRGHHHFAYAIYPHSGNWKQAMTVRRGYEFNEPLLAAQVAEHAGTLPPSASLVPIAADNVVLSAVKKAEDANALILRFYEWKGQNSTATITLPAGATAASLTNLMETDHEGPLPIDNGRIHVAVKPFEILTVRVEYAQPAAQN